MTPVNNDGQAKKGNLGQMRSFSKVCVENGWVCIAFDSNLGVMKHNADLYAAMEKLSEVWPNFKSWKFASGGFSGGSKACWSPIAYLVHNDYEVVGAMLAGCNAIYAESNRKRYHASKTGFRNIKVMLSNGNSDNIAPPSRQDSLENVLEDSGMRNVRKMTYDGGHRMNREHVAIALKWFSEAD